MNPPTTLRVNLPATPRHYDILIGPGLLRDTATVQRLVPQQNVCLVSNDTVFGLYGEALQTALGPDKQILPVRLGDGESYKTLASFEQILEAMLAARFGRDAVVVALGGGVVGDIAGFAASAFQRGVPCVQVPTTLLAQVDSSVGGKTGVNSPRGKNLIGAFHQPQAVLIDTDTLQTLPPREWAAGMAEVIKYALINDPDFLPLLENRAALPLAEVIARCCRNKAAIVAADEQERGQRALLNLGHTFGHALEALGQYERFKHGEAVAIGMVCALRLAEARGKISAAERQRAVELLQLYELPTAIPADLAGAAIYELMLGDKKVQAGRLRLVLPKRFGLCEVVADVQREEILATLAACR